MKSYICLLIALCLVPSSYVMALDLGGFEEGDIDGNGLSDYWDIYYEEAYQFDLDEFCYNGQYAEKITMQTAQGYIFGEWFDGIGGASLEQNIMSWDAVQEDVILHFFPTSIGIDNISNFDRYGVNVTLEWWDSTNDYNAQGDRYYVGSDLLLDQWNTITISQDFSDVTRARLFVGILFDRTDNTEGEWETIMYVDCATIPEPSMLLLAAAGLPFIRRRK